MKAACSVEQADLVLESALNPHSGVGTDVAMPCHWYHQRTIDLIVAELSAQ